MNGRFTVNVRGTGISISAVGTRRGRQSTAPGDNGLNDGVMSIDNSAVPVAAGLLDGVHPRIAAARRLTAASGILRP